MKFAYLIKSAEDSDSRSSRPTFVGRNLGSDFGTLRPAADTVPAAVASDNIQSTAYDAVSSFRPDERAAVTWFQCCRK